VEYSAHGFAVPLLRSGSQLPADALEQTFKPAMLRHLFPIRRSSFDRSGRSTFMLFDTLLAGYELAARNYRGGWSLAETA
jgi:hypothetical protein